MMETVAQVFPDFAEAVVLVDINVYDESNEALLKRVGLQYIPTLIFYDHTGKEQVSVGVMEAEQLRQTLAALAGGD
jgi:thiol:disulfide interchange protein